MINLLIRSIEEFQIDIFNDIISSVMHALWLVLTYDLLEDRRIDDVIITWGDASGLNYKYFLEILGYYPRKICTYVRNVTRPKVRQIRANKYEKINELMSDIKMSPATAFVWHAINSAFIPRPVPLHYIVDYKEKYIHTIYSPPSGVL